MKETVNFKIEPMQTEQYLSSQQLQKLILEKLKRAETYSQALKQQEDKYKSVR